MSSRINTDQRNALVEMSAGSSRPVVIMKLITQHSEVLAEREARIVARGEHSGHSHIMVGGRPESDGTFTVTEECPAMLRHLMESAWMGGQQVWTGEHRDVILKPGRVKVIHQQVYDPAAAQRRRAID